MWDDAGALGRLTRWMLLAVVVMLTGAGLAWLYHSDFFPVKKVAIEGRLKHADSKALQTIARQYMRGNIFRADVNGAQAAFQKLPWIDSALVRRRLPDTVEIVLTERVPLARWKDSGLVDTEGNVFQADVKDKLPVFDGRPGTGKDMVQHYHDFGKILSVRGLKIRELVYTPRSAWAVVLDNGITVRLGRENEIKRLQQFADIWPILLREHQSRLSYVDMRYKDGFAVRYSKPLDEPSENGSGKI
ncbi:cell division protein FtsQ/DivIB [Neisseria chenwenguii]|uniref:Cell division protein FtsQ n=1 Tax=Neisseria chenwenguii TaxID=1853278 RepID=A0A220S277_9NEIS|nr:cell division protein FtsQ/DivIB [Neisseria chenwenguii]ASK27589.1 cell division protein FtsQ [Neisseria chenwenguii]ROV55524.1 cell division protein FtsQ/DivIB [Neisseria chenwenguii]